MKSSSEAAKREFYVVLREYRAGSHYSLLVMLE